MIALPDETKMNTAMLTGIRSGRNSYLDHVQVRLDRSTYVGSEALSSFIEKNRRLARSDVAPTPQEIAAHPESTPCPTSSRMYVQFRNALVSRTHARFEPTADGGYCVYDLGSRNGTGINGKQISHHKFHPLKDGDVISLSGPNNGVSLLYTPETPDDQAPRHNVLLVGSGERFRKAVPSLARIIRGEVGPGDVTVLNDSSASYETVQAALREYQHTAVDNCTTVVYVNGVSELVGSESRIKLSGRSLPVGDLIDMMMGIRGKTVRILDYAIEGGHHLSSIGYYSAGTQFTFISTKDKADENMIPLGEELLRYVMETPADEIRPFKVLTEPGKDSGESLASRLRNTDWKVRYDFVEPSRYYGTLFSRELVDEAPRPTFPNILFVERMR